MMIFKQYKFATIIIVLTFLGGNIAKAQESQEATKSIKSIGVIKSTLTENKKLERLQSLPTDVLPYSKTATENSFLGKTRQQVQEIRTKQILEKTQQVLKVKQATDNTVNLTRELVVMPQSHHSFNIYSGYSQLITDIDNDGYFQTFSVTFDADILSPIANEEAYVYADLYLSQDGGPWLHYFSTDNFIIYGESTDDEFEVYTTLNSGYEPDEYDVLIDLYEVGFVDVVATYSSNDTNTLYALPLESSDYDPDYIEVDYHDDHGGAILYILWLAVFGRYLRKSL
jgi:hypothetical protein